MTRIQQAMRDAEGTARFLSVQELWAAATLITDTFPLERAARFPREVRRVGHCARLMLFDRAITDQEGVAVLSVSATNPWGPVLVLVVVAGFLAWAPRWAGWVSLGTAAAWAATSDQFARTLALRRELRRVAPDAFLVGDFVTREPGRGSQWTVEILGALGSQATVAAILPGAGDTRLLAHRARRQAPNAPRCNNKSGERADRADRNGNHEHDGGPHELAPTHTHWAICMRGQRHRCAEQCRGS